MLTLTVRGVAQSVYSLSVEQLFELGITHSLTVQSSRLRMDMAGSSLADIKSERLPTLTIGVVGGYVGNPIIFERGLSHSTSVNTPDWNQNYNVELIHPLYQGGKIRKTIERAALQRQMEEFYVERDVSEIKLFLMGKYLELLRLYKQQEVIETSIAQASQQLHDIQVMQRNGMVTLSDVLRSELQLSNYRLILTETKNDITILSTQLDIALGLDEQLILLPDSTLLEESNVIQSYNNYVDMAYSNYPELKISRSSVEVAQKENQIVQSDYLPQVAVKASNVLARPTTLGGSSHDWYNDNWNVGLTLSYDLSSLYHNRQKVNLSKQAIELQNIELRRTKQDIINNVKSYYVKHNESMERIKMLTVSVEQSNENYRIVRNKYQNHIAILTDLLDAGSLQLESQLQLTTAKINAVYTYYQLLRSSGNL